MNDESHIVETPSAGSEPIVFRPSVPAAIVWVGNRTAVEDARSKEKIHPSPRCGTQTKTEMIIDTKFTCGDTVSFMLQNRIESGTINEIEIRISREGAVSPTITYMFTDGLRLVNPPILCATPHEVAEELLK